MTKVWPVLSFCFLDLRMLDAKAVSKVVSRVDWSLRVRPARVGGQVLGKPEG